MIIVLVSITIIISVYYPLFASEFHGSQHYTRKWNDNITHNRFTII